MLLVVDFRFPRSVRPKDNVDDEIMPHLVTFSDGNSESFGVVAY